MSASKVPTILDTIVSGLDAVISVPVWDGGVVTGDYSQSFVTIGYNGDIEGTFVAATVSQPWAGLGAKAKKEVVSIPCAAVFIDGSGSVKVARDGAYALFAVIENYFRGNISLGISSPAITTISEYTYYQEPVETGLQARIAFTIEVSVRI